MLKKGIQIHHVIINAGLICAYDADEKIIPTTRAQRAVLGDYKTPGYRDRVSKAFGHPNPLSDDFILYKGSVKIEIK